MNFYLNLRRFADYASCTIEIGSATHDIGMLSREEAIGLLGEFNAAIEELEWFIQVTDKGE